MTSNEEVAAIFLPLGAGLVIVARVMTIGTQKLKARSLKTTGVITRLERRRDTDGDGRVTFDVFPEFRFKTADGKDVTVMSQTGTDPSPFREGATVNVFYPPEAPERAKIDDASQLWWFPLLVAVVGLIFTMVGFGMWLTR